MERRNGKLLPVGMAYVIAGAGTCPRLGTSSCHPALPESGVICEASPSLWVQEMQERLRISSPSPSLFPREDELPFESQNHRIIWVGKAL